MYYSCTSPKFKMLLAAITAVLLPIITSLWVLSLLYANLNPGYVTPSAWRWIVSVLVPLYVVVNGMQKKRLSQSGAVAGLTIGFLLSISCMRFLLSLLTFFVFGSKATKYRALKKRQIEADYKEGGQRNWIQVISNGGPAAILAIFYVWEVGSVDLPVDFSSRYSASWYAVAVMSGIASSCGDTFASEIGAVSGVKDPIHILTWKQVPRGTNGGISVVGTLSSVFGGLLVGTAFYVTELLIASWMQLSEAPSQWPVLIYGALAGFVGSMVDSFLGATLQYSGKHRKTGHIVEYTGPDIEHISGREILDNHSVNLLSSLVTSLVIPYIAAQTWPMF